MMLPHQFLPQPILPPDLRLTLEGVHKQFGRSGPVRGAGYVEGGGVVGLQSSLHLDQQFLTIGVLVISSLPTGAL